MKQYSVLRRSLSAAGLCLLLVGILAVSLIWANASPPLPVARPPAQTVAADPVARAAQPGQNDGGPAPQTVSFASEAPKPAAKRAVQDAWQRARAAGIYNFATDLAQVSYPARSLANVGRGPSRAALHMEGQLNQPARTLTFRMWEPGQAGPGGTGGAKTSGSEAEARIEGDRAYVRPAGGEWKEAADFSTSFAPDNDPLAFLAGIKNVREIPAEEHGSRGAGEQGSDPSRITHHVSRFTFQMDGPTFATYLRDRLESQLRERGELPLGVTLEAASAFKDLAGSGELWVNARGMPLRLTMHLAFPAERDGSRLEADVQTDFTGFPEQVAAAPALVLNALAWAGTDLPGKAAKAGGSSGALMCSLGAIVLLLACRRSRRLYAAVVVAVILSMVVVPLMQSERTLAFFERQEARSQDAAKLTAADQSATETARQEALANVLAPTWNPHQAPLAQSAQAPRGAGTQRAGQTPGGAASSVAPMGVFTETLVVDTSANSLGAFAATPTPTPTPDPCAQYATTADAEKDGVNDYDECAYSLRPDKADTDGDGLTDSQELYKLATNGSDPDTDGDVITDTVEVQGFTYAGKQWYLDPTNPDTNNDGVIDSAECSVLVDVAHPTEADFRNYCDSDQDNIPNIYEDDNDNDGVPDRVDLASDQWADVKGTRSGKVTDLTPFNGDNPFKLSVTNLQGRQGEWPVLVDLQMRPESPANLAYTMNVLDWPAGDVDGQIQHKANTTFADSNNPDIKNPDDDAGSHGDMRLIPLLEAVMTGNQVPLKLTDPAATVIVGSGTALSSTVTLKPAADKANTRFTFTLPQGANLKVYAGTCSALGGLLATFPGATDTITGKRVVELADGNHALVVSNGGQQKCAEITDVVNGAYTDQMVDLSVLSPYGITAHDEVRGGVPAVVAFVPLNVVTDDTGGGKSAFQSHMLYWVGGNSAWVEPQQMRIIWLVQMLTDSCADGAPTWDQYVKDHPDATQEEFDAAFDAYCATNRTPDQIVPVQTYDESWHLTGLSVREDHGLDVAVSYINPDLPTFDDDPLWTLSWGLGQQFVEQRDCETKDTIWNDTDPNPNDDDTDSCVGDGKRDLTIFPSAATTDHSVHEIGNSTIKQRFDITSTVQSNQRWGLAQNALRVENFRYGNQDYLGYLSTTETPRILATYKNHSVKPTLLYAREEHYRAAGLEAGTGTGNGAFTVDLNTEDYPEHTLSGLQWAHYRYNDETKAWEGYPSSEYWDALGVDLEARFAAQFPDESADSIEGRMLTARAYSNGLDIGVAETESQCKEGELVCAAPKVSTASDVMMIKAGFAVAGGLNTVAQKIVGEFFAQRAYILDNKIPQGKFESLTQATRNVFVNNFGAVGTRTLKVVGGIIIGVAVLAILATIAIAAALGIDNMQIAAVVTRSIALTISVFCTIHTIAKQISAFTKFLNDLSNDGHVFGNFLKQNMGIKFNGALAVGVVFTIISVAITWAAFVTQFYTTDMKWGSMGADSAFAGAIATTIVTVLLFVLFAALGPIGAIIGAVIGLINAIASLICSALPAEKQSSEAGTWLCGGITGIITNFIKGLIYSGAILVQLSPTDYDRLEFYDLQDDLVDPDLGVVEGNAIRYTISLTNTLKLAKVPWSPLAQEYRYQFNTSNLKESTFQYKWQTSQNSFHSGLSLDTMWSAWKDGGNGRYYITNTQQSDPIVLLAGINHPTQGLYLSEAYAAPEQECWAFVGCSIETEKSTSHFMIGEDMRLDVLPSTVGGFHSLTRKGSGWAQSWGQGGDLSFPTLYDADGDGLALTDDPDDSNWDQDGDGLSDVYELNNGSRTDLPDTDNDGLTDLQEVRIGSDPTRPDSDGDGLLDCQEVYHQVVQTGDSNARKACGEVGAWTGGWSIVAGMAGGKQLIAQVTSNPTLADTDGDGLSDYQEKVYGYNPNVWSVANVLTLKSDLSELNQGAYEPTDGFVAPGQTLYYSATVKNELDNRQADGLLSTEASTILDMSKVYPRSFSLRPQTQANMAGELKVLDKPSRAYSVTQVAGALISDLSVASDQAALWLRFDDPVNSTGYTDSSGRIPAHDGWCAGSGCTLEPAAGRVGGALKLSGTANVSSDATVPAAPSSVSLWFKVDSARTGGLFGTRQTSRLKIYLDGGKVCVAIPGTGSTACGIHTYGDNLWHHVAYTDPGQGEIALYVDGLQIAWTGSPGWSPSPGVILGGDPGSYLVGWIDEVRLFERLLTPVEVTELADQPIFRMDFDQSDRWADASTYHTGLADCGATCPTHQAQGVRGGGAGFNGSQFLSAVTSQHLSLTGGRFTLAAWVYPRTRGDARDTFPQGILGLNSGNYNAYPTLQRVGRQIRFGTASDQGGWTSYTSGNILTENQWNHVVATLDGAENNGTLRLYVNGELKETKTAMGISAVAPTDRFDIGRSSSTASLHAYSYTQGKPQGDVPITQDCGPSFSSEMCMTLDKQQVWKEGGLDCSDKGNLNASKNDFIGSTTMVVWEDDSSEDKDVCGAEKDSGDDTCNFTSPASAASKTSLAFTTNDVGFTGQQYKFNNCGSGDFYIDFTNNSIPFYGDMDELQIFAQPLDEGAVRRLYLDAATLLRLPLDEAPGATAFEDLSRSHVPASCTGSTCPTSGVAGRIEQAAQFAATEQDVLVAGHSAANELTKSFTVAAWVKPGTITGVNRIVSTAQAKTENGWSFSLTSGNLAFEPFGYGKSSTTTMGLQPGRWYHVAAVVGADYSVKFYVNGAWWQSMGHSGYFGGNPDTDDQLLVGAGQLKGAATPSEFFNGQIDDLWIFNSALSDARIAELYNGAPMLDMRFEEANGATRFADNAAYDRTGTCTGATCPLTGEAVRGQVGLAAQFDGLNDFVEVPNFGTMNTTTVSAWVYRTGATTSRETVVSYKEASSCGFVLALEDQKPRFYVRVGSAWPFAVDTGGEIPTNQWVHLAGTYDGSTIRLYRNGVQTATVAAAGGMANTCTDIMTIGGRNSKNQWYFPGAIDEVRVYSRVLTPSQIRDMYLYQSAWVQDRQSHDITVDNDSPTAAVLIANGSYLARQEISVGLTANDPTSGVATVELRAGTGARATAARCIENADQPEGAWCAPFAPASQGTYSLYARATDRVGRTGAETSVTVYVDDSAPAVTLGQGSYVRLDATQSGTKPNTWVAALSGTVKDPDIATGVKGSGVPADGVLVTLRAADGTPLGDAGQIATVTASGTWSLNYAIPKTQPDGCYEVTVEAVDAVARIPNLDPTQVTAHSASSTGWVVVDASAPVVQLDQQAAIAGGQLGPDVKTVSGETSVRTAAVQIELTAATGADKSRVQITCQDDSTGSWYTLADLPAGSLAVGGTRLWEEDIHLGSACRVVLTPAGGVSGNVKACGKTVKEWTGEAADSKTVDFTATSDACAIPGCPARPSVAGVQGVDLAFRPVLPGSPFVNEVPLTGEVLHLPFEDTPDSSNGLTLRDVSGAGINGTCSESASSSCPTPGQVGPSESAAWFDGTKDNVQVVDDNRWDFAANQDFTVAVWARPDPVQPDTHYTDHSIIEKWSASGSYPYVIRYMDQNDKTNPGKISAARYQGTQPQPAIFSDRTINDGRFHHLVFVKAGSALTLYIDGTSAGATTDSSTGTTTNTSALFIGQRGNGSNHFAGMVDDVRIFNRGLSAAEVNALYFGPGPLLALPFEKSWGTDGADLPDASGWGHDATLHTGDATNQATSGQVGAYALKFDGTNDNVRLANFGTFGNTTASAWVNRTKADTTRQTIVSYKENLNCGFVLAVEGNVPKFWVNVGGAFRGPAVGSAQIPTNQWQHLAGTYDGSTIRVYRNGMLEGTYAYSGSMKNDCEDTITIGSRNDSKQHWFPGSIDEVRIYGRALPAPEVADLFHAGWQAAILPSGGVGAERTSWTAPVPAGLEGAYQVEMRGQDTAQHVEAVSAPSLLWRGEADNLKPRVTLTKKVVNTTTNEYTTVAEDYHLVETDFTSPCGAGVITKRETFQSPWYLGSTGDSQRLYRLTAVCQKPNTVAEQAKACDSFGNCATLPATAAAQPAASELATTNPKPSVPPARPGRPGFEISTAAVVTTSHYYEPRTIDVLGLVTDKRIPQADWSTLASVRVRIADAEGPATLSDPATQWPYTTTWTFPWRLPSGSALPDGVSYTAAIAATDLAGQTTTVLSALLADVVLPAPVTLTLASNGLPVAPGAIIRETSPDLALTWTPSSDGSGLNPYQAAWRFEDAFTTTIRTSLHDPAGPREARITGNEAQRISAGLASLDRLGNARWQPFGSVIVDTPLTPDYITPLSASAAVGDGGWMDSGCTLMGADPRIARRTSAGRWNAQSLYATWDHQALGLAWTGANWSGDGDLFIYLDTGPGGTTSTFTPESAAITGTTVTLPPDMQADALIWVRDSQTAALLRWDGSTWSEGATALTDTQFRFDGGRNGGQTDLYLPFELLGLPAGASLGLLAFAAEEPAPEAGLRVWATLPLLNPVNSSRVNISLPLAPAGNTMALRRAYRWTMLGDGVCPNLKQHQGDAALQMTAESDPPGATVSGLSGGLFWVADPVSTLSASMQEALFGTLHAAHPALPDGQEVAYTVRYRNEGNHTLEDAWLALSAFGALRLAGDRLDLGDIPPGGEGAVTFAGTVDRSRSQIGLAVALARLYAATDTPEEPLEWLIAAHRVDRGAPEEVGLNRWDALVGPETGWLGGYAHDESGVKQVQVDIVGPSGTSSTLTCDVSDQATGGWSCLWDVTAANGGVQPSNDDEFTGRLRATDRFGYTSVLSAPQVIRVDAQPPTVTLAAEVTNTYAGGLVRGSALRLIGDTQDNRHVGTVTVCLDADNCEAADVSAPGASASRWSQWVVANGTLDYVTKTLTIRAADRLGNRMAQALDLPVVFDNVAPVLAANQTLAQVLLGSTETVLSGTVSDGGPDVAVSVRMQPPSADITRIAAARDGKKWRFDLPADVAGRYTLWVDAEDLAGNVSTTGPYTVDVFCTDAAPVATSLTAEPLAGSAVSLTLTTVISNTGPDPLPAGIPVALYDGAAHIGQATTTVPLAAGESQALSLVWAPDGTRDYDIALVVGQIANLTHGPLCITPATMHFNLPLRDVALDYGWNLISPPLNPSNTDVQVVQRGIDGAYAAILGYDGGLLAYHPDRPLESTLQTVDALHAYWIRTIVAPGQPVSDTLLAEPFATWHMAGQILPEDQPLSLASGWNLAAYLPRQPLTVTEALQGIAGNYGAVLGFERTALSYYPDLDPSYNTLRWLAPDYGYWISATQAITLQYPLTGITETVPITATRMARERLQAARLAEWEVGVQPTYEWMNFYGKLALPDGTGVPTGTVVLAVDPQGVICGATAAWEVGQYGLLACYRDDPDTAVDEGAVPGDAIRLVVGEGSPPQPGSWVIGEGLWIAHGARQQVPAGPIPELPRSYLPLLFRGGSSGVQETAPLPEPGAGS